MTKEQKETIKLLLQNIGYNSTSRYSYPWKNKRYEIESFTVNYKDGQSSNHLGTIPMFELCELLEALVNGEN